MRGDDIRKASELWAQRERYMKWLANDPKVEWTLCRKSSDNDYYPAGPEIPRPLLETMFRQEVAGIDAQLIAMGVQL